MARPCSICTSPLRGEIELALQRGLSVRQVAGRFSVSRSSIDRHVNNGHCIITTPMVALSGDLEQIADVEMYDNPSDLLAELKKASLDSFNMMRRRGDDPLAIAYLKEIRALLAMEIEVAERKASKPDYVASPAREHVLQGMREHRTAVEKERVLQGIRGRLDEYLATAKRKTLALVPAPSPAPDQDEAEPAPHASPQKQAPSSPVRTRTRNIAAKNAGVRLG